MFHGCLCSDHSYFCPKLAFECFLQLWSLSMKVADELATEFEVKRKGKSIDKRVRVRVDKRERERVDTCKRVDTRKRVDKRKRKRVDKRAPYKRRLR